MEATSGVPPASSRRPTVAARCAAWGRASPDLLRGSGNYSVPIELPAGPNELRPQLSLRYSTGQGNGPYGLGWQLSVPPSIMRGTDDRIPQYDDTDDLLLGGDVLVDVGGGRWRPRSDTQFWDSAARGRLAHPHQGGHSFHLGTSAGAACPRVGPDPRLAVRAAARPGRQRDHYGYRRDRGQLYLDTSSGGTTLRLAWEPRPDVLHASRAGFRSRPPCAAPGSSGTRPPTRAGAPPTSCATGKPSAPGSRSWWRSSSRRPTTALALTPTRRCASPTASTSPSPGTCASPRRTDCCPSAARRRPRRPRW